MPKLPMSKRYSIDRFTINVFIFLNIRCRVHAKAFLVKMAETVAHCTKKITTHVTVLLETMECTVK